MNTTLFCKRTISGSLYQ